MIVAVSVGKDGVDAMLVASQVVLSIVLPFIVFPLVWLTSSKTIMRVRLPHPPELAKDKEDQPTLSALVSGEDGECGNQDPYEECQYADFSNGWYAMGLGYAIWLLVVVANGYVIIQLILGNDA